MAALYRASRDYATQYASLNQGYTIGIEQAVFVKAEVTAGTALPPAIGTQGSSISNTAPSTDISAGSNTKFRISVDGGTVTEITLVLTGLNSGANIATGLQTQINAALSAAGFDTRVWVEYNSSLYKIRSQRIGTGSSVVITAGSSVDVAVDLKLGLANTGVEAAGANGSDYLVMTKGSHKFTQPRNVSKVRSGRQPVSTIKGKKMLEGEIETYVNIDTSLGAPAIDTALKLLIKQLLASQVTVPSVSESFSQLQAPSSYVSIYETTNVTGAIMNGCYAKSLEISLPGDAEAMFKFAYKGRDEKACTIAQASAAVVSSAAFITNAGESRNFEIGAYVMVVDNDGRTVVAGGDGTLKVSALTHGSNTVTLNTTVSCDDDSFLVPYDPYVLGGLGGTNSPLIGLEGSVSFDNGSTTIDAIRSCTIKIDDQKEDLDKYYGSDSNLGYVISNVANVAVTVEINMTAQQYNKILRIKDDARFALKVVLGNASGRRLEVIMPVVQFSTPAVDIPETGSVPVTFEGFALQSAPGALDAITLSYK